MARLCLVSGQQRRLLDFFASRLEHRAEGLAKICHVHPRTIRDWRREKFKMSEAALRRLCGVAKRAVPKLKVLPEFSHVKRAGRLGALRRYKLYGNPGTPEGRRKGGLRAIQFFKRHSLHARLKGFAMPKKMKVPRHSSTLAEFIGIMIGDGGVRSPYQVGISFHRTKELQYARWIQHVIKQLFGLKSSIYFWRDVQGGDVVISSRNLVCFLSRAAGLRPGDKLRNGLDVPQWIWSSRSYQIACLRGLMDTDGGLVIHRYQVNNREYTYPKLQFCSGSPSLIRSVCQLFSNLGFHPRPARKDRVWIDRVEDVRRFYRIVGSRHARHRNRVKRFVNM